MGVQEAIRDLVEGCIEEQMDWPQIQAMLPSLIIATGQSDRSSGLLTQPMSLLIDMGRDEFDSRSGRYQAIMTPEHFGGIEEIEPEAIATYEPKPWVMRPLQHADGEGYTPPEGARKAAARGLELRQKFGRGGTSVGVARARDISNGKSLSRDTIARMVSFFARHAVDKKEGWSNPSDPTNGYIAALLWGGPAGKSWCNKIWAKIQRQDSETLDQYFDAQFTDDELHQKAVTEAKAKFSIWPSAYASAYVVKRYKELYQAKHGGEKSGFRKDSEIPHADDLKQWFKENWVRISAGGDILGACGDRTEQEGKPKCLPASKAKGMSKEERATAVRRKRREDPDADREGSARSVGTSGDADAPRVRHTDAEPLQVEGSLLSGKEWENIAEVDEAIAQAALEDWQDSAPVEQFGEILDAGTSPST